MLGERARSTTASVDRGQSSVIGVVLIMGMTVMGVTGIMLFGTSALSDANTNAEINAAEHAMTQLDSQFSLVALGSAGRQDAVVNLRSGASLTIDEERGWMNITVVDGPDGNIPILNETLGAATYENDGTTIAYQGGGVWKKTEEGGSVMVSPPEFHYRIANGRAPTLTIPLIVLRGQGSLGETVSVHNDGDAISKFPVDGDSALTNPLGSGKVAITVQSSYYEAWGGFFQERTSSSVRYDHQNETVHAELTIPFDESYGHVLATTGPDGITLNGGDTPEPHQTGISFPSADSKIEDRIVDCHPTSCNNTLNDVLINDTYYSNSDLTNALDIDTSDGNVTIVVNGSFTPTEVDISGSNSVTVYVREDFNIGDEINDGGSVNGFRTVVHSDGDVTSNGKFTFVGFIYAPKSGVEINGGGAVNFRGGIIGESVHINGKAKNFEYDPSVSEIDLDLDGDVAVVTYMHASVNRVNVSSR